MTDKVVIVTPPDDITIDGIRFLTVDLDPVQTKILSDSLTQLNNIPNLIVYLWKTGDNVDWLIDKKHKSSFIIFNANSNNDLIIGYMAAQKESYYMGNLKILTKVNESAIYSVTDCVTILQRMIDKYE